MDDDLGADICGVPPGSGGIVALDGNPLEVLVTLNVSLCKLDSPVHLEPIVVTVLVVASLCVICPDALIGPDVIERSGGLDMSCDSSGLCSVRFRSPSKSDDSPATVPCAATAAKLSRHIDVSTANEDGIIMVDDGEMRWCHEDGYLEVNWNWANGREPASRLGPSIGEYLRKSLTEKEESLFCNEVHTWIDNGWLVLHKPDVHDDPAAVLPLMAVSQQHKSTPVRPVLDYRALNDTILSMPGTESPVSEEKLRKWRMKGNPTEFEMLDIRRAYLQVRVSPELHRYQTVIWQGKRYGMTRMGFEVSFAPKSMDNIIRYVTRDMAKVDNYVDGLMVPRKQYAEVVHLLMSFDLPTKPAEKMSSARVLGLQLTEDNNSIKWSRRVDASVDLPEVLTKRSILS